MFIFFSKKEIGRKQMRNERKNNVYLSNFIFSSKTEREHMRVRDQYNFCEKLKKV